MHELTRVIIRSGLVAPEFLAQFRKWGLITPDEPPVPISDKTQLIAALDRALQEEELVIVRETDLDALNRYLAHMHPSKLHVVMPDGTTGDFDVTYGKLETGEYIFPWHFESVEDVLANGETYLLEDSTSNVKIYFSSVRELFFGDHKAFVVCTPSPQEVSHGQHEPAADAPAQ